MSRRKATSHPWRRRGAVRKAAAAALPPSIAVAGVLVASPAGAATQEPAAHTETTSPDTTLVITKPPLKPVVLSKAGRHEAAQTYIVRHGDTLSGIAKTKCGKADDWTGIYAHSKAVVGGNPNLILPGQHLALVCKVLHSVHVAAVSPTHRSTAHFTGAGTSVPGWGGYFNPFRAISNLQMGRVDEGVDIAGDGPVYAIGHGVVTYVSTTTGWPDHTFVVYRLNSGPLAGKYIYIAESFTPSVSVGDHVGPHTVLGTMHSAWPGIETGFAMPPGDTDTALAYNHYTDGQPTPEGEHFQRVLHRLRHFSAPATGPEAGPSTHHSHHHAHHHVRVRGVVTSSALTGGAFEQCVIAHESGGNPRAVNPSSGAGGLFQFLPSTWHALGFPGLPEDAPVAEQYAAFNKAYAESGTSPWAPYDGC